LLATLSLGLTSCGIEGNDPTTMLQTGTVYNLATPWTTSIGTFNAPFTATNDGITFNIQVATAIRAMAPGLVTKVDVENSLVSVTFFHSDEVSSKISLLQTAAVRVGDYIQGGSNFGTSSNFIRVSVLLKGGAVCPYSFLEPSFKSQLSGLRICEI
jgi:hypothetical protein